MKNILERALDSFQEPNSLETSTDSTRIDEGRTMTRSSISRATVLAGALGLAGCGVLNPLAAPQAPVRPLPMGSAPEAAPAEPGALCFKVESLLKEQLSPPLNCVAGDKDVEVGADDILSISYPDFSNSKCKEAVTNPSGGAKLVDSKIYSKESCTVSISIAENRAEAVKKNPNTKSWKPGTTERVRFVAKDGKDLALNIKIGNPEFVLPMPIVSSTVTAVTVGSAAPAFSGSAAPAHSASAPKTHSSAAPATSAKK